MQSEKQKYRKSRNNNRQGCYAAYGQNVLPASGRVCSTLEWVGAQFRKEPTLVFGGTMKRKGDSVLKQTVTVRWFG